MLISNTFNTSITTCSNDIKASQLTSAYMMRSGCPDVFRKLSVHKNFAEFTRNACARVSFLIKLQVEVCDLLKQETLA